MVQMVGGAILPGRPVANMYFTMYGYNSVVQSYHLMRDLKLVSIRPLLTILCGELILLPLLGPIYETPSSRHFRLTVLGCHNRWSAQLCHHENGPVIPP
jgi:hypothetical protein